MFENLPKGPKTYVPAPSKPRDFDQRLRIMCGVSLTGKPRIRVEWGWNLRTERNGNRDALKYPGPLLNYWIVEQWVAPAFFGSKKQWEANRYEGGKPLFGEYPYDGEYIMVMPLMTPAGEFAPCDENALTFINMMRQEFEARVDNAHSGAKLYAKMQEKMEHDQAVLEAEAEKEAQDFKDHFHAHEGAIGNEVAYSKNLTESPRLWTPN